jgi:hypothetical protein
MINLKKNKKQKGHLDDIWIELGIKSFARFYALDIEDAITIASNPNDIFFEMIGQMNASLNEYEDFMVRIKKMDVEEKPTRLDILDL